MTNQAIVDTIVKRIVARFQLARILLFGSRARGTDNRWSDVDLSVVVDEVENKCRVVIVLVVLIDYTKHAVSTTMTELPAPLILHCDGIRTQTQFPQRKAGAG